MYEDNSTKYLLAGSGCNLNRMSGLCDDSGNCIIIRTISPIIAFLQDLVGGVYIERIANVVLDYIEIALTVFFLYISIFSSNKIL